MFEVGRSMLVTKHLAGVAVEVEYCFCAVHLACGRSYLRHAENSTFGREKALQDSLLLAHLLLGCLKLPEL